MRRDAFAGQGASAPSKELMERARRRLPADVWAFLAATAGDGRTAAAGAAAWDQMALLPRRLTNAAGTATTSTTLLGERVAAPIAVAPVGLQRLFHSDGESATARGAASVGVPVTLSWSSSVLAQDVRAVAPDAVLWQQLYPSRDDQVFADAVARAEGAGCQALVLTIDVPVLDDRHVSALHAVRTARRVSSFPGFRGTQTDRAASLRPATADDVEALVATGLPVLVKGVLHPRDAELAVEAGAAAVVVSDHGGRQLDGAVPAAVALAEVVGSVGTSAEILVDGGVRRGVDVVAARALGADAVMVGRPAMYGLATGGASGVRQVLERFILEVERALVLCGIASIADVDASTLQHGP